MRRAARITGRTAVFALLLVAIAAVTFHSWTSAQGRASIVLTRASNTPFLSWLIGVGTDEPRSTETVVAGQPTFLVEPGEGSSWPGIVFLNGVTRRGRFHPTVRRLARALARAGYLVAVPDPPGLRTGTLTPETLDATSGAVRAIADRSDVHGRYVSLFGVSVGASLALLAAERPALVHRVREVVGLAPYSDLVQIVRLVTTGVYHDHGRDVRYRTKPFAALVVARSLAAALAPGLDRGLLVRRLDAVSDRAPDPLAALRAFPSSSLAQPARRLVRLLLNRDPARFDSLRSATAEDSGARSNALADHACGPLADASPHCLGAARQVFPASGDTSARCACFASPRHDHRDPPARCPALFRRRPRRPLQLRCLPRPCASDRRVAPTSAEEDDPGVVVR